MRHNDFVSWIGSIFGTILTALQTDAIFQWISLGLTILSTLIAIAFTIWKWIIKAREDGKITKEEVQELEDELSKHLGKENEEDANQRKYNKN